MAEPEKKWRRLHPFEKVQRKRELDKKRGKTRVNIGEAYTRWRELKAATKSRSDCDLAFILMDSFQLKPGAVPSLGLQTAAEESSAKEAAPQDEPSSSTTEVHETDVAIDQQSDPKNETEESSDAGEGDSDAPEVDSDDDWNPPRGVFPVKLFPAKQNKDSVDHAGYNDYLSLTPLHNQLCTDCGKFFDERKPHTCVHKKKPYSCYICGKRCVSEVALNSHSRIHNENYEFCCKFCNVSFKLRADKFAHEQIHLVEGKPYQCPDCSETFATNKERRIHLEEHRGTIELKCRFCGLEFLRGLSIRRHLLTHTGAKPYKCSVCERGFNQQSHLKSHMRLHTGERPYKCQHCDKCFNHNVSLKNHVQRYHPAHSGPEPEKDTKSSQQSDSNSSQSNGDKNNTNQEEDNEEEDTNSDAQISDNEIQTEGSQIPVNTRRSTGRPKGRPKNLKSNTGKLHRKRKKRNKVPDDEHEPPAISPQQGEG